MKCYNCGGLMQDTVELVISKGKTFPQAIMKCVKCHKSLVSAEEYEKTRKELHPSLLDRFKRLFQKVDTKFVDISKGRLL